MNEFDSFLISMYRYEVCVYKIKEQGNSWKQEDCNDKNSLMRILRCYNLQPLTLHVNFFYIYSNVDSKCIDIKSYFSSLNLYFVDNKAVFILLLWARTWARIHKRMQRVYRKSKEIFEILTFFIHLNNLKISLSEIFIVRYEFNENIQDAY